MLTLFVVVDVVIVVALLAIAVTVLVHDGYRRRRNIAMALFCALIAVWTIANHVGNSLSTPAGIALVANYFVFSCSFGAMVLVTLFVTQLAGQRGLSLMTKIATPFLLLITALSATPLIGAGVEPQEQVYGVIFGPLVTLYGAALVAMIAFTIAVIIIGFRRTRGLQKNQLQVIGTALLISLPLLLSFGFILPSATNAFWLTEFATIPLVILVAGIYYSVIKQQLFDVRFVAIRSAAYICVLAVLAAIYYVLAYVVSIVIFGGQTTDMVSMSPINIVLALILTVLFQPVKQIFDRATDKFFFKASYRGVEFITRLNSLLGSTTNLRGMLERVSDEIGTTLKASQTFFFLRGEGTDDRHMSAGTPRHSILSLYDVRQLDAYMEQQKTKGVFLVSTLDDSAKSVRRMLVSHRIFLVVPLKTSDHLIGYLFLGEHQSSNYTKRDLSVLATISHELVIAIQNALSLHEVQELNETLQQRINVATKELRSSNSQLKHLDEVKDEFMSMASHQLRTPLTSIKGYLSMVLEGDAGHISPQQRKLLEEAYKSSERMVGLIADFLNVSRLQTGKFVIDKAPFDFKDVVRQEVADLQLIANTHDIKLRAKLGVGAFPVVADEQKLRQVIMNLIDNAIYYSPAKSTVVVNLERVKDQAALTVVDPGIGVPEAEQSRLFNKFFRARNARKQRPDGTGVGLYLARRVVTAHGGGIIFSSKENKGSTFGFRIPIDETAAIKPRHNQATAAKTTK